MPKLSISRRTRTTPFTSRVMAGGVKALTVYNHMLLPAMFRSLEEDYWHLCEHVQVWDVACERQIQIQGEDAYRLVQLMTPRDLSTAQADQCFYVPLCDEDGGLVNDPIAIHVAKDTWWLSIADSDVLLWAKGLATGLKLQVRITEADVWPIAVQGPKAETLMQRVFGDTVREIRFFRYKRLSFRGHEFIVARSGWSKQVGFEIYVDDAELGQALWDQLFEEGADLQVGHGSPNLLERIESSLLSYGGDMDRRHTPLQCGLDKYCHLDRDLDSLSLSALRQQRATGVSERLVGLVVPKMPAWPQQLQLLLNEQAVGELGGHCLSARYDAWLGLAMVKTEALQCLQQQPESLMLVTELGRFVAKVTELPFDFAQLGLAERAR